MSGGDSRNYSSKKNSIDMFLGKPNALHYHEEAPREKSIFCFVYYFNKQNIIFMQMKNFF